MEKLVSSWFNDQPLPQSYIFPPETRPGNHIIPRCNTLPLTMEFQNVFKEFFELPAEDKAGVYSDDPKRPCRLYTSSPNYDSETVHLWRDNLRHPCHPLEECIIVWPQKPNRYRESVAAYSIEAKKLGLRILELVSEGLGLSSGKIYVDSKSSRMENGSVSEPLPNAFVVNIGLQLQIISNNKLKSAEHRASLLNLLSTPTSFRFKEFLLNYISMTGNSETSLEPFKLHA
ncbi:DOWNY MILDEW RESISTANT 6 [Hibiscus trionum]|uniref:DOWNY MILDEW RESISTANT 6 n=1 Tax=Hibiscus trionum TaxID=183268 RepID=A0A9W7I1C2_HIBTR|nr:DOWNY MILDEW RESISTANT 6 [Hibiscus trionum]